jgi:6-phosphofructokinase
MANVCPTCGSERKSPRSVEQHRRFFSLMRAAFTNWPETHERQFSSEEELRKYLTMKAGHRELTARIPLTGIRKEQAVVLAEAAIRAAAAYAVAAVHGSELIIWKPKSIAFHKLGHLAFCELNSAVDEILLAEIGISGDELLQETERAA